MLRKCLIWVGLLFSAAVAADDTVFYTQYNFWFEKGKSLTTNYRAGVLLPVNSKVTIKDMDSDELELTFVEMGFDVNVVNVEKHTKMSMEQIRDRLLAKEPVNLEKFSKLGKDNIKLGNIVPGMTKAEVLVSRGYPPAHATPSTQINSWMYWQNKFNRVAIQFDNDKVVNVQE